MSLPHPPPLSQQEQNEPQEIIVDFDILERAKENVQRLASGRKVSSLLPTLGAPIALAQKEARNGVTRKRMRMMVDVALEGAKEWEAKRARREGKKKEDGEYEAEDDDEEEDEEDEEEEDLDSPLQAYQTYIDWTLSTYPQGASSESGLIELLEEATRTLKDLYAGRYRQEKRYLKMWLLYAGYVERPEVVLWFLVRNEIGTDHVLVYEELAACLERDGRCVSFLSFVVECILTRS